MRILPALTLACVLALPAQAAPRNDRLWAAAQAQVPTAVETLKSLVNIETPSREVGGMAELGEIGRAHV